MEQRALMALLTTEIPLASPYSQPGGIVSGPGGKLWFTESEAVYMPGGAKLVYAIGSIDPTTHAVVEYPTQSVNTSQYAGDITVGPGGKLWFTEPNTNKVAMFDPSNGDISEYTLPTANSDPTGIALGADGFIYVSETAGQKLARIDPTSLAITEIPLLFDVNPMGMVAGPDGNIWFIESPNVASFNPTTQAINTYKLPQINGQDSTGYAGITVGPDQNLWFSFSSVQGVGIINNRLGSINPTTHDITTYIGNAAAALTPGPDGNLYSVTGDFRGDGNIYEFNLTTQAVSASPTPAVPPPFRPVLTGITLGPDGNLWYTDANSGRVGEASLIPPTQAAIAGTLTSGLGGSSGPTAGRTIFVDLKGDGTLDAGDPSTVTDYDGNYTISGLAPGTYTLRVLTYPGELVTTPTGGSLSVTITGGQLAQSQNFNILSASSVLPFTYNAAPFGSHNPDVQTAEVTGLYSLILGRAPDATGLATWVGALKAGTDTLPQVVNGFLNSSEYLADVVASYYRGFLDRAGSAAEIGTWVAAMQGGRTEEQVVTDFLASPEFNHSHVSNSSFVQSLYNDLLGRSAATSEVSAWVSLLNAGTSRSQVIFDVLESPEADTRAVVGFYNVILAIGHEPSGVAYWVSTLQNGATQSAVSVNFFSSPTFVARANATVG